MELQSLDMEVSQQIEMQELMLLVTGIRTKDGRMQSNVLSQPNMSAGQYVSN